MVQEEKNEIVVEETTNEEEINEEVEEEINEEVEEEINEEVEESENKKDIPWGWINTAVAFLGLAGTVLAYLFGKNSSNKELLVLSNALKNSNDINNGLRTENCMLKDEIKHLDAVNGRLASDLLRVGRGLGGKEMRRRKK